MTCIPPAVPFAAAMDETAPPGTGQPSNVTLPGTLTPISPPHPASTNMPAGAAMLHIVFALFSSGPTPTAAAEQHQQPGNADRPGCGLRHGIQIESAARRVADTECNPGDSLV